MSATNEVYKTMGTTFRQISTTEGTRRLWKGVGSVVMGAGPAHAVYFGTYEIIKESLGGNKQGQQILATGVAGSMATIASDALMNPFDGMSDRSLTSLNTAELLTALLYWLNQFSDRTSSMCFWLFNCMWYFLLGAVIKQRMQVRGSEFKTVFETARAVHRAEGLRAFYM